MSLDRSIALMDKLNTLEGMGHNNSLYHGMNCFYAIKHLQASSTYEAARKWMKPALHVPAAVLQHSPRPYLLLCYEFTCGTLVYIIFYTSDLSDIWDRYSIQSSGRYRGEFGYYVALNDWHSGPPMTELIEKQGSRTKHFAWAPRGTDEL